MCNVQYFDPELDRSFNKVCNSIEEAEAFLATMELENCEGFIETFADIKEFGNG